MKKSYVILLLILSFGFMMNVNAAEYVPVKFYSYDKFDAYDMFKLKDKIGVYSYYNLYEFDGNNIKQVHDDGVGDLIPLDDETYAINDYEYIYKYNKDHELLETYTSNDISKVFKYKNGLAYYAVTYLNPGRDGAFKVLDDKLNLIDTKDVTFNDYVIDIASYDDIVVKRFYNSLNFLDSNFNTKYSYDLPSDVYEEYNSLMVDLKVFGKDEIFVLTKRNYHDAYFTLLKLDSNANLLFKKVFKSSIEFLGNDYGNIIKLENGNYLLSIGSLYEIDKDGNIVNSCVKCTEGIISEELNGKIYSLTYDFDGTAEKSWLSSFFVGITEYGFEEKDKLTIKDSDNGRVRVSRSNPHAGEEVVITLRPEVGYEYGDIKLLDKDGKKIEVKKITDKKYSFIMPSGESTLEVLFKKLDK